MSNYHWPCHGSAWQDVHPCGADRIATETHGLCHWYWGGQGGPRRAWVLIRLVPPRNHPDLGMFYGHFYCKKPTAQKSLLQAISKLDPGLRDFLTRAINLVLRGMLMDSLWTMLGQLVWSSSLVWLPEGKSAHRTWLIHYLDVHPTYEVLCKML